MLQDDHSSEEEVKDVEKECVKEEVKVVEKTVAGPAPIEVKPLSAT